MCRMAFAIGDKKTLIKMIDATRNAAEKDNYRYKEYGVWSHPDGWGYVFISSEADLHAFKSDKSIFAYDSKENIKRLKNLIEAVNFGLLLIHARAASDKSTVNLVGSHPYYFSTGTGIDLWFAHNGSVDHRKIVEKLYEKVEVKQSDSYYAGAYITKKLSRYSKIPSVEDLFEIWKKAISFTKSAFDTFSILLDGRRVVGVITSYYKKRESYYRLFKCASEKTFLACSSTIHDYAGLSCDEMSNPEVVILEFLPNKEKPYRILVEETNREKILST